jgi:hypothetical protein
LSPEWFEDVDIVEPADIWENVEQKPRLPFLGV